MMDSLKKYLKENEEHLVIEEISEKVWYTIVEAVKRRNASLVGRIRLYTSNILYHLRRNNTFLVHSENGSDLKKLKIIKKRHYQLALTCALAALLIASCTYRVETHFKIGELVSFNLERTNTHALQQISNLKSLLGFKSLEFIHPRNPRFLSYNAFIENKSTNRPGSAKEELRSITGLVELKIVPINSKINESLFSFFLYKTINVHVDAREPEKKDIEQAILSQLKTNGIDYLAIKVSAERGQKDFTLILDEHITKSQTPTNYIDDLDTTHISSPEYRKDSLKKITLPETQEEQLENPSVIYNNIYKQLSECIATGKIEITKAREDSCYRRVLINNYDELKKYGVDTLVDNDFKFYYDHYLKAIVGTGIPERLDPGEILKEVISKLDFGFKGSLVEQKKLVNGMYEILLFSKEEKTTMKFISDDPVNLEELKRLVPGEDNIVVSYNRSSIDGKEKNTIKSILYLGTTKK